MDTVREIPIPPSEAPKKVPPLQNGDRLTRAEFERRYAAMPHVKKAELIEGIVYMPSPVCHTDHGRPHFNVIAWLGQYAALTPGVEGGDNSLRLDAAALLRGDLAAVLRVLQQGLASAAHAAFVERLEARAAGQ